MELQPGKISQNNQITAPAPSLEAEIHFKNKIENELDDSNVNISTSRKGSVSGKQISNKGIGDVAGLLGTYSDNSEEIDNLSNVDNRLLSDENINPQNEENINPQKHDGNVPGAENNVPEASNNNVPEAANNNVQQEEGNRIKVNCLALGIEIHLQEMDEQLIPEVDVHFPQRLEDYPNCTVKQLLTNYLTTLSTEVGEVQKPYVEKMLRLALASKSLEDSIKIEQRLAQLSNNASENEAPVILSRETCQKFQTDLGEKIIELAKRDGKLSDETLKRVLDSTDFNISSCEGMLEIVRRTVARLVEELESLSLLNNDTAVSQLINELKPVCVDIVSPPRPEEKLDTPEELLNNAKKKIKEIRTMLNSFLQNKRLSSIVEEICRNYDDVAGMLNTQINATARQSIKRKLREAQSERIRLAWEAGRSQTFDLSVDIGGELGILGLYVNPKFSYSINVPFSYGRIAVSHSFAIGGKMKVTIGPVDLAFESHGSFGKVHYYNTPEELVEAESDRLYKKLMHLAKPLEIPRNGEAAFVKLPKEGEKKTKGALARLWRSIKNIVTQITTHGKDLFRWFWFTKDSAGMVVKHALAENNEFKDKLIARGILGGFDELRRDSINMKLGTRKNIRAFDIGGSVKNSKDAKLPGWLKKGEGKLSLTKKRATTNSYTPLLTALGESPFKLQSFLQQEYLRNALNKDIAKKHKAAELTDTTLQDLFVREDIVVSTDDERSEINGVLNGGNPPVLNKLERKINQLAKEYQLFCQLTSQHDYAKGRLRFRTDFSDIRNTFMALRGASNRGEYLRKVMTRFAALKFMLLKHQHQNPAGGNVAVNSLSWKLEQLGKSLENPPFGLSKSNLKKIHSTGQFTYHDSTVNLSLKVNMPNKLQSIVPLPSFMTKEDDTFDASVQASLVIPRKSENRFYGNHKRGTITFSVTGDKLLQYGPQLLTNVIQGVINSVKSEDTGLVNAEIKSAVTDSANDLLADVAHDLATSQINEQVKSAIESNGVFKSADDVNVDGGPTLKFEVAHKNIFTFSISLMGDGSKPRLGGISVSNTRNLSAELELHAPRNISLAVNTGVSVTDSVLTTLGTDTFAQLIQEIPDIRISDECMKAYGNYHSDALVEMFNKCTTRETVIHGELERFCNHLKDQCERLINRIGGIANTLSDKELHNIEALCDHSIKFLRELKNIMELSAQNVRLFNNDLLDSVKNLLTKLKIKSLGKSSAQAESMAKREMGYHDLQNQPVAALADARDSEKYYAILQMAAQMQFIENYL